MRQNERMRYLIVLLFYAMPLSAMDFYDGHIHYNRVVWKRLPPAAAIKIMDFNGIKRAIVSSTPAAGTDALYEQAPDRIIPFIRPYRTLKDVLTWHHDPEIVDYVREQAATGKYRGFGEFHIYEQHLSEKSVFPELMQIAADNKWPLSAHTDEETIEVIFKLQPSLHVMWAHCGFTTPPEVVRAMIETYPRFYCELSFYEKLVDEDDNLLPGWKALMEDHPDRIIAGTDPFSLGRWGDLQKHAGFIKEWLAQLTPAAAEQIARGNIARLFPEK